jgi:hypothetical protein
MEFILSQNQKALAIQTARTRLESELFACAILAGINPEELEFTNGAFTWQPTVINSSWKDPAESRLRDILDVYERLLSRN